MKKLFLYLCLVCMLLINFVSAGDNNCNMDVTLVNQNPYPAVPGEYVHVVFQVSDVIDCQGGKFKLVPTYPFSLDAGQNAIQEVSGSTYIPNDYSTGWMVPYKVKVDGDALSGDAEIEVQFATGLWKSYLSKKFNITIKDTRTNFDAVIQDISGSDVSIALANIGKYNANSIVVRIPDQDSFKATDTNGQMVGNLESGDYTIVSFSLTKLPSSKNSNLKFDIYYTDNIGERRVVNMELPLSMGYSTTAGTTTTSGTPNGSFPAGMRRQQSTSFFSKWYTWMAIILIMLIIGGFILHKKYPGKIRIYSQKVYKKIKRIFVKKKSENSPDKIPDWIKKVEVKEKKG